MGKMEAGQMLAHVSVAYDLVYDENHGHKPPGGFAKFMLKLFVKGYVVGDKAYKKMDVQLLNS